MGTNTSAAGTTAPQEHELRRNAVGTAGIVFFVVAAAAPLAAALGAGSVAFISNGVGTPGAYLIASLVLLLFAVGFAAMSSHVTSAGGFAVYISKAMGERAGITTAFVALVAYNGMLLGLFASFGYFATSTMATQLHIHLSWEVWTMIAIAIVGVLGYRDINLGARILGALMLLEVLILTIFDIAVIAQGGHSGLNLQPFSPSHIFSGSWGIAFLFAFGSFVGFEATAIYGEEARDPKRTVRRATYAAIVLIGAFYTLATYAIAMAVGGANVQKEAIADPVGFIFAANTQYVGAWSTHVMNILLVTSTLASVLAFHNTLARYTFSLSRGGVLPSLLGMTHKRFQSPHAASLVLSAIAFVVLGIFMAAGADPFTQVYSWLVGVGTVGVLALQAFVSLGVIVYFQRTKADRRPWQTIVAPALGGAGLCYAIVVSIQQFSSLAGTSSGIPGHLYWVLPIAAAIGWVVATLRTRRGARLERGFETEPDPTAPTSLEPAPASA